MKAKGAHSRSAARRRVSKGGIALLECPLFPHELGDVGMNDAIPLLNGVTSRQQILGIVVLNQSERPVYQIRGLLRYSLSSKRFIPGESALRVQQDITR